LNGQSNAPTATPATAQFGHGEARRPLTLREKLPRMRALAGRGLAYWKGALTILVVAMAVGLFFASRLEHVYRAECTVMAKARIRTDDRDDSSISPDQILRQSARLKDLLTTRSRLEGAIKKFALYPATVADKTMLDAVEEMKPHVGFRSLDGAQYVISFDGGDPDTVQKVTAYLSASLIDDYAASDMGDLRRDADFLAKEEQASLSGLEEATRALTVFLAAHPEFAVDARQAAAPLAPGQPQGIPLVPRLPKDYASAKDPGLAALYRERMRLEAAARSAGSGTGGPQGGGSLRPVDDHLAEAQLQVEAAAKRVAEAQADLASKSNLTEDHPDMRAARMSADAAARQLRQARVLFASLQQLEAGAVQANAAMAPHIGDRLRQVDAEIAARRTKDGQTPPGNATAPGGGGEGSAVTALVELETDWQRLLRALGEAKSRHDDLQTRAERASLALEAARVQENEQMAVIDPPVRPTHPSKGGRANAAIGAVALAWLLGIAYATSRVALDDTLIDPEDFEGLGLLPILGVIPKFDVTPSPPREEVEADAVA
jgi:hypothetical protein